MWGESAGLQIHPELRSPRTVSGSPGSPPPQCLSGFGSSRLTCLSLSCLQEEVLRQRGGHADGVRHHGPQGGAADGAQRAVPTSAHHGLEHMCLHHSGHRYNHDALLAVSYRHWTCFPCLKIK